MLLVKNNVSCVAYEKLNKLPCESLWIQIQADSNFIINFGYVIEARQLRCKKTRICKQQYSRHVKNSA